MADMGAWLGIVDALMKYGQQGQAQQYNQRALANSLGLQGDLYGRVMGSPGYVPEVLGYGIAPYVPGESQYTSPIGTPGGPSGGDGSFMDWLAGPSSWFAGTPLQYSPAPGSGAPGEMLPPGTMSGKTGIPDGNGGFLPDVPSNRQPDYMSQPDLARRVQQGFANRAAEGITGATALQDEMRGAYNLGGRTLGALGDIYSSDIGGLYGGLYGDIEGRGNDLAAQLGKGYSDRYTRNMNRLAGLGSAEEGRIREGYRTLGAEQNAGLNMSGLGGTTIGSNLASGRTREMTRDLGDLNERLRRELTGYDTALSGEALQSLASQGNLNIGNLMDIGSQGAGAQTNVLGNAMSARANLLGQGLQSQQGLGQWGLGFGSGLTGDYLGQLYGTGRDTMATDIGLTQGLTNTIESVNYPYPQGGALDSLMGYFGAQASRPESSNDALAWAGLGTQLGGSLLALPFSDMRWTQGTLGPYRPRGETVTTTRLPQGIGAWSGGISNSGYGSVPLPNSRY